MPEHRGAGGFDHADVHSPSDRLYVAHPGNDAIDIIDCAAGRYLESIPGLNAVAGALVSEARGLVFTSNRGENTVALFAVGAERELTKIPVGLKPNGLAFDSDRGLLIAANVGDPQIPGSHTVSVVDVERRIRIVEIHVPGRTRWCIYDPVRDRFFINIAAPARIVAVNPREPTRVDREYEIPAAGPHSLDLDPVSGRLLCACDAGLLVAIEASSGRVFGEVPLSGPPDVVVLQSQSRRLYVAIGEPGVIDVVDVDSMRRIGVMPTESGAHTLALDRKRNTVYAFLPGTHRAQVFLETIRRSSWRLTADVPGSNTQTFGG
ncbi:MAG: hypothetical protein GEV05_23330 [Betaproteobacteria bacterium]|nr:hypothetical protein [Betaproteobacteria bacterium]